MMASELLTRHLAIEIFSNVFRKGNGLEEEFARQMDFQDKESPLELRDRMFVRLLVTVMLRRLGQIDHILAQFLTKPLPDRANYIKDILRVSVVQLVFLDTPPHAGVSTGVSLAKSWGIGGFAGLVNAVLRQVSTKGKDILATQDLVRTNIPSWLLNRWEKAYGEETARKISLAGLQEAPLDFSVKDDPEKWAERLEGFVLPTGTVRRSKSSLIKELAGFDEGQWWVQDVSASIPVKLFKDIKDKSVIDLCAAPGGKTAQLLLKGADVTVLDVSANRLNRLKENMKRLDFGVEMIVADARKWWQEKGGESEKFDAVLLDAPCSATGTLRRHPDVLWHRTPEDVLRLNKTQADLIHTALDMLVTGGELVYCVCSLLPEEGEQIVQQVIDEGLAERVPVQPDEVPDFMISSQGDVCIFPFFYEETGGCDGFYSARLRRKG